MWWGSDSDELGMDERNEDGYLQARYPSHMQKVRPNLGMGFGEENLLGFSRKHEYQP